MDLTIHGTVLLYPPGRDPAGNLTRIDEQR
jgi:hypothetical protein